MSRALPDFEIAELGVGKKRLQKVLPGSQSAAYRPRNRPQKDAERHVARIPTPAKFMDSSQFFGFERVFKHPKNQLSR
jgi:hypothetical protein